MIAAISGAGRHSSSPGIKCRQRKGLRRSNPGKFRNKAGLFAGP
jgi:hypothetical protein